ncbi:MULTISPECIES: HesA/MoeB/ThiF family protein [Marinomonas]|uniref:Molybdopterin-synthase adenylyltransferase MoeB n=1 Tax=Marinomonas arctica TaxID=383750 RepID=A0A7H1JC26_9GAMM|nr:MULTISPECIES: molybdopterin-synthase adenylyltransferase MoeB [Marinomonas]MCS7485355.1 molybdopterin-synthase adenylyltransferase [Marinomonas sp. BSi20414]QNT08042.1 molybdopterin-synthase adenylyltransferase MoeB [Marinomonas arctica]
MNESELDRYSRQLLLPNFDIQGQLNLTQAKILIIGLGGLGNIAATYLATSGVGKLVLADGDQLECSNLPRQVLYAEHQLGLNKVDAAAAQIALKNSAVQVEVIAQKLADDSLLCAVEQADVVLDCTDNFTARQVINRACLSLKKPLVSAAAIRWEGQLVSFLYHQQSTPCYECLYPSLSDQQLSCNESGIIAPVVGLLGVYQALEALKLASGCGKVKHGVLRLFDGLEGSWREMRLSQDPECSACSLENS